MKARKVLAYGSVVFAAATVLANVLMYVDLLGKQHVFPRFVYDLINIAYFVFPNGLTLAGLKWGLNAGVTLALVTAGVTGTVVFLIRLVSAGGSATRLASVLATFVVLSLVCPLAFLF